VNYQDKIKKFNDKASCCSPSLLSTAFIENPNLIFVNVYQLERQGADIQTKVEELEDLNHSLRVLDKMKHYAIAHLSDQLVAITTRLQEVERRQRI
jgi:hypothetical protein